jgi:NAD(P)H-hydrate epimerase
MGQGLPPDQAACAGVYLHGRAGDMLAWRKSQAGVIAGELADELAYAFREVTLR